jgi:predicted metal-binding transcription factor (methanogenesis marker protein 9)
MGGDFRALSFCCKPGHSLTFGFKCLRDEALKAVQMTPEKFMEIKATFSKEHDWEGPETCFGSLTYCCMRQSGCYRRDAALARRYPDLPYDQQLAEYFRLKRRLATILIEHCANPTIKKDLQPLL